MSNATCCPYRSNNTRTWNIKHDPNFFVYDMEGNLVFEAYSYDPHIEPVTVTKEYRGGCKNEVMGVISHTKGTKITL